MTVGALVDVPLDRKAPGTLLDDAGSAGEGVFTSVAVQVEGFHEVPPPRGAGGRYSRLDPRGAPILGRRDTVPLAPPRRRLSPFCHLPGVRSFLRRSDPRDHRFVPAPPSPDRLLTWGYRNSPETG